MHKNKLEKTLKFSKKVYPIGKTKLIKKWKLNNSVILLNETSLLYKAFDKDEANGV